MGKNILPEARLLLNEYFTQIYSTQTINITSNFCSSFLNLHDICLMHSSHSVSVICFCILECKVCNSLGSLSCDQLDTLYYTINNL